MKNFYLLIICVLPMFTSCKKSDSCGCNCSCTDKIEVKLTYEGYNNCLNGLSAFWRATLTSGETVILSNISDFKLEHKDQIIKICPNSISKCNPIQIEIDCIEVRVPEKNPCECKVMEWLILKPVNVKNNTANNAQLNAFKADGTEIFISNLDQFKLEMKEQKLQVCFEEVMTASYPPQYRIRCIQGQNWNEKKPYIDPYPNKDSIPFKDTTTTSYPCDNLMVGTVNYKGSNGGCDYLIQLEDGSYLNAVNLGDFKDLAINGMKIYFAFKSPSVVNSICNMAKPIEIICGKPIK